MPNPYADIDAVLDDWAAAEALTVMRSFGGRERRFCYGSSDQGDTWQISIEPPEDRRVTISLWDVETHDDREMHLQWVTDAMSLREALDEALRQAKAWTAKRK